MSIVYLGNMDASEIPDPTNAIRVAKLLGVDPREMVDALTMKTIVAQGDSVVSWYSMIIILLGNGSDFSIK